MRFLVVEDDCISRKLLVSIFSEFGECDCADDGLEAIYAVSKAISEERPYDLISLDIMMPHLDGHDVLESIRNIEERKGIMVGDGIKIIMTTALCDSKNVLRAFNGLADGYVFKPIIKKKVISEVSKLGIEAS